MPPAQPIDLDYRPSYLAAALTSLAVFILYAVTLAPTTAMWDTSEYIASAFVLGNPHPPGNPLFVLLGRVFAVMPLPLSVAVKINLLAAVTSALSAGFWFLITERVLVGWLTARWQRITGGALAALIGATAFTVWNQSVVNEKVYTVSLLGLAAISWLTVRWSDDPDGPAADRLLVLIAYLLGLGYANHMMGFLAAPAVAVAVLVRRPQTILRWRLLLICAAAVFVGVTVFAFQPIRAAHFPAINEGEPTGCRMAFDWACTLSKETWDAFMYNFNRGQYGKPSVFERQAPFTGQLGMYWLYFKWQWVRDSAAQMSVLQNMLAALYMLLGLFGGWVHWKRDRRSFWYFGTFMFTLTLLLIFYLNFKYGHSQCMIDSANAPCEVRDRDYFFLISFSAWGVWAALGFIFVWEAVAELLGSESVRLGKTTLTLPTRRSWLLASPVLLVAFIPIVVNWTDASRAGQTLTRDFAHDMLNSVEPYGVLVTVGDNDTFPLWYAQEVEGIRKDVVVANTSLLNTDWYVRQLIRRPVYEYDAAAGPAIYRGREWSKPDGSPLRLTLDEADRIPELVRLTEPRLFRKETPDGTIQAMIPEGYLERADQALLLMIRDSYPQRPIYISRTAGSYGDQRLGLTSHLLAQGLARKLVSAVPREGRDTLFLPRDGWIDVRRSLALWDSVFLGPAALAREGKWVDNASVGIPLLYVTTAAALAQAQQIRGEDEAAQRLIERARELAAATGN
ncbi:MAG TPA: DUF2723 domain-containing protein [Gemmatimonadaceae bacterium]|nr:DUF2723 domain-containing protein [Gemmatimonadaceae bacterium]